VGGKKQKGNRVGGKISKTAVSPWWMPW
jgi:hypothetical protein